jgi:hypothetical protein
MRRLAPLLVLLACGKGTITAQAFPAAFAQAICLVEQKCQGRADYEEKQCEDSAAALYGSDLDKAIAKGTAVFHADAAQTALDGFKVRGCGRTRPEVDQAWQQAVTGTIAPGAACNWLFECAQGNCEAEAPGACPAKCGTVAGPGQSCQDTPCDQRQGLRCLENVCSTQKGVDDKCSSDEDCQIGLYCDGFSRCSVLTGEQAVCGGYDQCADGLFCDLGSAGGLCRKQITSGQPCTAASADAIAFACQPGYVCKGFTFAKTDATAGTCALLGQVNAGCVASAAINGCADGLVCSGGTCQEKPTSGHCVSTDDCKDGVAYCDQNGQCQLLIATGGACQSSDQCATGLCDPSSGSCIDSDPACHEP